MLKVKRIMFGLILVLTLTGHISAQTGGGRTAAFFRIFESGTYHMKSSMTSDVNTVAMVTNARGGMLAVTSTTQGMTSRMVLKDGKTYMIMDFARMIMVMPMMSTTEAGGVETAQMRFSGSGTARFDGKNLPYDEYSNPDGIKVQYFIDGSRLAGIRSISKEGTADLVISEINQNVPNNAFDIPSGYQMQEMPKF